MVGSLDEPFPVKPETREYKVLRVLVAHQKDGATPDEIVARTELSTSRAVETLGLLSKSGIVYQENGVYYIGSDQVERLKRRLKSVDAVVQLFESAPDDTYAEKDGKSKSRASAWRKNQILLTREHRELPRKKLRSSSKRSKRRSQAVRSLFCLETEGRY